VDEVNAAAGKPSAVHMTVISIDNDGSTLVLSICIEGKNNVYTLSTMLKKRKYESGRCSRYDPISQFQDMLATKLP
jgi:hypothetical protein